MKKILVLGAGKSATDLIHYLLEQSETYDWHIMVADRDQQVAAQKIDGHPNGTAIAFDVYDKQLRHELVQQADIVASILPAQFHHLIAEACLEHHKHIITPSYVSAKEQAMDQEFKEKGLLFMGEMGLDPGIDHMTLMKMLNGLKAEGAKIEAVRSCCGALMADESDGDNPWKYKFTWAPMNVVKAGQGTAQYLRNGSPKYLPYNRLFVQHERYDIDNHGTFEAYANRDSMSYIDKYQLEDVPTFVRCTLRKEGFCDAWNALVKLGWTDHSYTIDHANLLTYRTFVEAFLPKSVVEDPRRLRVRLAEFLNIEVASPVMEKLIWLGIFEDKPVPFAKATPAEILLHILKEKWVLQPSDRDMVVMLHKIDYALGQQQQSLTSWLVVEGKDAEHTAISKTVGLPMGILIKLMLNKQISLSGVHIPTMPEVYYPVLEELETYGIVFRELAHSA